MKKITAALIGAGQRGMHCYAPYALRHPHKIQFVAVAEPDPIKRAAFQKQHAIADDYCFASWEELLAKPAVAEAMFICTQDQMHFAPTIQALAKGYHVLLEKPMSTDPSECLIMGEYANKYNRIFSIGHVLRYTDFFSTLKQLLNEGSIGQLVSIQHNENVGYWHQAHSYVRGNWRNSDLASPMILAKSCHDMDILLWLAGAECVSLSSFGSLTHFKHENAPAGAPLRCLDGCPVEDTCPFYAPKTYLTPNTAWPTSVISHDMSMQARTKALQEGPYGRCVYHCDNNVVDHQVVNMLFANEVTAVFTMCAFTNDSTRTIKLMGTKGEIKGMMEKNEIEITHFSTGAKKIIQLPPSPFGHSGGDDGIMRDFVRVVAEAQTKPAVQSLTSVSTSVQSHLMAFAAEKSRLQKEVIHLSAFTEELKSKATQ